MVGDVGREEIWVGLATFRFSEWSTRFYGLKTFGENLTSWNGLRWEREEKSFGGMRRRRGVWRCRDPGYFEQR